MPSSGRPFSEVAAVTAAVFPAAVSPVVSEVGLAVEVSAAVEPAAPGSIFSEPEHPTKPGVS